MPTIHTQVLPVLSIPGKPLGRHVEHDEQSRAFAVESTIKAPVSVEWNRRAPIFNQGSIGSCTGNAAAGVIGTDSKGRQGLSTANEALAVEIYSLATHLDRIQGIYPPYDTGSTGIAACKAARKLGFIAGYRHAFSIDAALRALQNGPCLTGISWLTGCDDPDSDGLVQYKGYMRGGHEIVMMGYDLSTNLVKFANSWGPEWGKDGYFFMSKDDFATALRQGGDVTQPVYV